MAVFYLRYRRVILPLGFWLVSLILVSIQSNQKRKTSPSPFSRGLSALVSYPGQFYTLVKDGVKNTWKNYIYLVDVQRKNLILQKQITFLQIENERMREQALENKRLKSLLEFKDSIGFDSIPARIIGWDLSSYARLATINVGYKNKIHKGQAVISPGGLVGQIIDEPGRLIEKNFAKVLLITDPTSRVSVLVERTRDWGVVEGTGEEQNLLLKYLSPEAKPSSGDTVITSGLGGIFPSGIKVGVIKTVKYNPFTGSPQCQVKPSAEFRRLEEVLVIKKTKE